METRASYVLIGAFTLAGFLGIFGFFLWFANVQLDRQFAYYDIDFTSVSGLSDASDVRFAGLSVGQVVDVRLAPSNSGLVRVRVEVETTTPVRTDSIATIEAQGVTGVSYVGISSGDPGSPLLADVSDNDIPSITAGRSVLQTLSEDAPAVLAETLEALRDIRGLISAENQTRVETILVNVEQSSAAFSQALDDFADVSGTVADFAREIDEFNSILSALSSDASDVLQAAEAAIDSVAAVTDDARTFIAEGSETMTQARSTIATTEDYISGNLAMTTDQLSESLTEIQGRATAISTRIEELIATYDQVGETATLRLQEAEQTLAATNELIARTDATMQSVDAAAQRFDSLVAEGADPLIAELRIATAEATTVITQIGEAARTDLPATMSELRATAETVSATVSQLATDLTSATGNLDAVIANSNATLDAAQETFANANDTLASINAALGTGERALASAEAAFTGADQFINEDLDDMAESLRRSLSALERTVGDVSAEIPLVTADLRDASRAAQEAFNQLSGAVDQSAPAVRDFATSALPQYGRLANETRALIDNLDALVEQIRRDPSRFFIDPRAPEYRR